MRRFFLCMFLLISATATFGQDVTLGIMDLSAKEGVSEGDADAVTDFVFGAVYKFAGDQYRIIARNLRDTLLTEQQFALSGLCDDVTCALEVGKYLAAEYMLVGTFTKFGSKYYISFTLVNVNTTEVSGTARIDAPDYDTLVEELDRGLRELLGVESATARATGTTNDGMTTVDSRLILLEFLDSHGYRKNTAIRPEIKLLVEQLTDEEKEFFYDQYSLSFAILPAAGNTLLGLGSWLQGDYIGGLLCSGLMVGGFALIFNTSIGSLMVTAGTITGWIIPFFFQATNNSRLKAALQYNPK